MKHSMQGPRRKQLRLRGGGTFLPRRQRRSRLRLLASFESRWPIYEAEEPAGCHLREAEAGAVMLPTGAEGGGARHRTGRDAAPAGRSFRYRRPDLPRGRRGGGAPPPGASNPGKLTRHLIEGCLAYPNENQQLLALYWGLAYAYRAIVQHSQRTTVEAGTQTASEDTMLEIGTQTTTTTVIAPIVKRKQWTRRSTGPYHRLVREEEEEERLDLEAGPSIKKLEEGVRELKQEAETTRSLTSSELRDLRKDYSRQPGERIAAWLLRCWDNGADSQQLEGKEAQQLGSLARNRGIERGIGKEAAVCSLWSRLLSSVRARYPFKEDLVNSSEKWTTADEGIQYLRELAVVEVIYSDLDDEEVSKDPEDVLCTRAMWRKVIQGAPASYSNSLAAMYCPDVETPTVEKVSSWLQNFEENLCVSSSLQDSALAVRDAPRNQSFPAPVRGKGSPRHMPRGTLWFFLRDQGEDMRKWDGEPTFKLEARVCELRGKTAVKKGSPKKKAVSIVAVEAQESNQRSSRHRRTETTSLDSEIKQLSTLPGLSEDPFIVGLLQVEEQQVPIATRTVHRQQYQTNRDSLAPIHELIHHLESQGVISKTHSPFNSPIWPVQKSDGGWRLTVDYHGLNEVTPPLSAAVPDMLELQYELASKAATWYATIDIANAFFSIPLAAECRPQFAFTWRGVQYTWNRLPQGWKHSPTICHGLIQTALEQGDAPEHLQYIDDIIVWGNEAEEVFEKGKRIIQILLKAGFAIKKSKVKGPAQEIQFLGIKWQDGCRHVPMDVVNKIATMSPPANKKETQAFLGLVGFWRMHIPGYSQLVSPLYRVMWKKNYFEWGPEQQQAFEHIRQEIARAVALGPVRTGPDVQNILYTAAGEHGLTWSLWQKTPGETRGRPLGFWSQGYRGSEAHYTPTEKEILAAYEGVRAASEVVGTEAYLLLAPRLPVLHWMFKGNIPSTHHATSATWSKWIALITQQARLGKSNRPGILEEIMDWPEGRDFGASPEEVARAQEAPPYNELSEDKRCYALFTDGSCRVVGNHRKWKAAVWSPT
ncbi:PREDICTED: uncharacterized protein LOC104833793 [Haliaeetus leucocephalus]|uniref:uncharacterized protein LOC104833793 n=1 Tax=Haliaeetus leucocephalus TaxID=52644 RepID=UPI00053CB542|nr:PREDICTED: uncharacterized protein LOC104833793 [Haliaeetus leucocephalus]